jgi:aminopeptidase N
MRKYARFFKLFFLIFPISLPILLLGPFVKPSDIKTLLQTSVNIRHYDLNLDLYPSNQLQPNKETMQGKCTITFRNDGQTPLTKIPALLYRLLDIKSVTNGEGQALHFTQKIVKVEDFSPVWQINKAEIELSKPVPPGKEKSVSISYGGFIYGYPEVFRYTKDHVGTDFMIIREDVLAYPKIMDNSWNNFVASVNDTFDFELHVSVPDDYLVANGGRIAGETKKDDRRKFVFRSQLPDWRIDVAAGRFDLLEDENKRFRIYHFSEDTEGAKRILAGMMQSLILCTRWIGEIEQERQFTVIEIPEGYGGQSAKTSILLPVELFSGEEDVSNIYHETAHFWEVPSLDENPSRWLSEGFANYFMTLILKELHGQETFDQTLEGFRSRFKSYCASSKELSTTPIADYGRADLTNASYTKGALALHVLHEIVGDADFKRIFRLYFKNYHTRGATLEDFRNLAEKTSRQDLKKYFDEWVYGNNSSSLLLGDLSMKEIAQRYR